MKLLFIIAFCLTASHSYCQSATNTESADSTNIYCQALQIFLTEYRPKNANETSILIESNSLTTEKCPNQISSFRINYVDGNEVSELLKKENEITVIRVIPLRVKNGDFFVNIIPFAVHKEKDNIQYVNSGGTSVHFTFDEQDRSFNFARIKHSGI